MTTVLPLCVFCKHRKTDEKVCDAFPRGIPTAIYEGGAANEHRDPFPGDRRKQFEPKRELLAAIRKGEISAATIRRVFP